jgi:hypothetical protein
MKVSIFATLLPRFFFLFACYRNRNAFISSKMAPKKVGSSKEKKKVFFPLFHFFCADDSNNKKTRLKRSLMWPLFFPVGIKPWSMSHKSFLSLSHSLRSPLLWKQNSAFDSGIRGRCYDHNFLPFLTIFGEFFLHNLVLFWVKKLFFRWIFRRKYIKKSSVPGALWFPGPTLW